MSMDEDAMFKALLKKKPQQPQQTPVKKEVKEAAPVAKPSYSKSSEDAMFQVLLKNKPQQPSVPRTAAAPVKNIPAEPPIIEEPVMETRIPAEEPVEAPVQAEIIPSLESLEKLNVSVNMVYGLLKTAVIVLVLLLVVGIAVLVKLQ